MVKTEGPENGVLKVVQAHKASLAPQGQRYSLKLKWSRVTSAHREPPELSVQRVRLDHKGCREPWGQRYSLRQKWSKAILARPVCKESKGYRGV